MSQGYKQSAVIDNIDWDYRKDPTRITITSQLYSTTSQTSDVDGTTSSSSVSSRNESRQLLGPQRSEVYLSTRQTEEVRPESTGDGDMMSSPMSFAFAERSRTVTVGPGNVVADDQEVVTEYTLVDAESGGDTVRAISRVAVFLTPNPNSREGVLWQQIGGRAVAMYDYELILKRNRESFQVRNDVDGSTQTITRPCVSTPKDVVQCH